MSETPAIVVRVVSTHDDDTKRADLTLTGTRGVAVFNGRRTEFPAKDLWSVVRHLLPPVEHLRAAPARTRPSERHAPDPDGFAESCRSLVVIAVGVEGDDEEIAVRTWLATDSELYAVTAGAAAGRTVLSARPGAIAEQLVWDVTGAMERLVRTLRAAS